MARKRHLDFFIFTKKDLAIASFIVLAVILVLFSGVLTHKQSHTSKDANTVKEQDLYIINSAVESYIGSHGYELPNKLADLNINNLEGNQADYDYTYSSRSSNGGPTLSYSICASFTKVGSGQAFTGTVDNEPIIYTIHKTGKTCFYNEYYKSSSHIYSPIKTD